MTTDNQSKKQITRILVANRGEIALRVMRSAQRMGIETVAVYSDADADAQHVRFADIAVRIGSAPSSESYLNVDAIMAAAAESAANAIHPGYGFLAENAAFARACTDAGLQFIGPGADAIELMGSKRLAKLRMIEADVPCVPGYEGADQSDEHLIAECGQIGLPVMIKASAGGGGRGMRRVEVIEDLPSAIRAARSEATNAFGSGELIIEKAIDHARHVEIQVFGDEYGNVIHLGERDCSIQRRHQKVVEEAPSPAVDTALRETMGNAAVKAAQEIGYVGAGTVEFLLGDDGQFYFMEMNTRLQVEHPVTEMITGLDLVELQIRVARGEPLGLAQHDVTFSGHAIEVRLCAEDPSNGFMPQTGNILRWDEPQGDGIRLDHGICAGGSVSRHYDSMLGKLISWAPTRAAARQNLVAALRKTRLHGLPTNIEFLASVIDHEAFTAGTFDTGFIEQHYPPDALACPPEPIDFIAAGFALYVDDARQLREFAGIEEGLGGWYSSHPAAARMRIEYDGDIRDVTALRSPTGLTVGCGDESLTAVPADQTDSNIQLRRDGADINLHFSRADDQIWVTRDGCTRVFSDLTYREPESADDGGDGTVRAPSDGRILSVSVTAGATVERGATLCILESMKMEIEVTSTVAGDVTAIHVAEGDQVSGRQLLVEIAADA